MPMVSWNKNLTTLQEILKVKHIPQNTYPNTEKVRLQTSQIWCLFTTNEPNSFNAWDEVPTPKERWSNLSSGLSYVIY
jgi:hypothetical protein